MNQATTTSPMMTSQSISRRPAPKPRSHWASRAWSGLVVGLMTFFLINVGLMIASVATNSVAKRGLGTLLPSGWTIEWYSAAWQDVQLGDVLLVTIQVVLSVVVLSILIGVPAAYTLARRNFRGKKLLTGLFLLPLMIHRSLTVFRWRP